MDLKIRPKAKCIKLTFNEEVIKLKAKQKTK